MVARFMKTRTVTTRNMRVHLNRSDIRRILAEQGITLPRDAAIYVRVPGGGDWSNTNLDLDNDCPVIIEWSETEETSDG